MAKNLANLLGSAICILCILIPIAIAIVSDPANQTPTWNKRDLQDAAKYVHRDRCEENFYGMGGHQLICYDTAFISSRSGEDLLNLRGNTLYIRLH